MADSNPKSQALAAASERRIELKEAVSSVERAAASPSAMPSWRDYVLAQLERLRVALDQHCDEVEKPDGLLAELTALAPRLVHKIDSVRDEHPMLRRMVADTIELARSAEQNDQVRDSVLETLFAIVRHRQHGADLVFEGYNVDIGGGG